MKKDNIEFPEFWFESNLYFGWVRSIDDLNEVFKSYEGQMTKDSILDVAVTLKSNELTEFGMRREHKGDITLREFLIEKKIKI